MSSGGGTATTAQGSSDPGASSAPPPRRGFLRRISLSWWIIISMVVGVFIGWAFPESARSTNGWAAPDLKIWATLFLRMIKSLIVPLIFGTLVIGIAGHGDDMKRVGRLAFRSIVYFEIVTTLALALGLGVVNLVKPGVGVTLGGGDAAQASALANSPATFSGVLIHTVPQSFFEAASNNEVLQIVFFAIIFAVALSQLPPGTAKTAMLSFCDGLSQVMFKFTGIVMKFAPIGIGAAIAVTVGTSGLHILGKLAILVLSLYASLVIFVLAVLLPVAILFKVPVRRFIAAVKDPWLIAFTTASSEAALPLAMERMEEMGVPRRIVAFVIPTGYSFNLDGTTLYLALASVFIAQAAGVHMSLGTQLGMMLTLMLTSKGVAGVPRAALVILAGAVAQFQLPIEGVAILLGIDAFMDMARTSVNVVGNCLASAVMARLEGELPAAGAELAA